MKPFTKLFLILFILFLSVYLTAIVISCFTQFDFVATSDYLVMDTGSILIISTKYGMCIPLDKIYLPVDTVKRFSHKLHIKALDLATLIEKAVETKVLNMTIQDSLGTFNSTHVCGFVIIRYR